MLIIESLLLTALLTVFLITCYTDCRTSTIENRILAMATSIVAILDIIYYVFFAKEYLIVFLLNLAFLILIAIMFYGYHLWAAGDSKLLIFVGLAIPGRIYTLGNLGNLSSFTIIVFIFSIAFAYVIAESIYIGIKERSLFDVRFARIDYRRAVISYFTMVAILKFIDIVLWKVFGSSFANNGIMIQSINFLAVLTLIQFRERITTKQMIFPMVLCWGLVVFLHNSYNNGLNFRPYVDVGAWVIVLIIMFVRIIAEKYNYQTINTEDVKAGQILSAATVLAFRPSRVKGLPEGMTEDLRSRITLEEAESVKRWGKSKLGKPQIVIVRKIPFAIFITIGTFAFVMLEVILA